MFRKLLIVALFTSMLTSCGDGKAGSYLDMLKSLRGTSYWTLQCSTYITTAHHFHHCGAAGFWKDGCGGALAVVEQKRSLNEINPAELQPGDVLAFHGVHVAAYVGNGKFMDSDPNHDGVGDMTPDAIHGDLWFNGQVKVLRWKS